MGRLTKALSSTEAELNNTRLTGLNGTPLGTKWNRIQHGMLDNVMRILHSGAVYLTSFDSFEEVHIEE